MSDALCHVHCHVAQRSRGAGFLIRKAYQECGTVTVDGVTYDYSWARDHHVGTAVVIPPGADPALCDPGRLAAAVLRRDTRRDAQQGRLFDITLPRATPRGDELLLGAWVLAPFIACGMVAQLDAERPPASDGGDNPHLHAILSMREVAEDEFGLKRRDWNTLFRKLKGRYVRCLIAGRLMAGSALLGCPVLIDPRRKEFWSDKPPELRLHYSNWRAPETRRQEFEQLIKDRERNRDETLPPLMEAPTVTVENPALVDAEVSELWREQDLLLRRSRELGFERFPSHIEPLEPFELRHPLFEAVLSVDGFSTIQIGRDQCSDEVLKGLSALLRACEWPALVVTGSQAALDSLAMINAHLGLVAINARIGPSALNHNAVDGRRKMLEDIRAFDPLALITGSQLTPQRLHSKQGQEPIGPQLENPDKVTCVPEAQSAKLPQATDADKLPSEPIDDVGLDSSSSRPS